jgi:hypothetical protein
MVILELSGTVTRSLDEVLPKGRHAFCRNGLASCALVVTTSGDQTGVFFSWAGTKHNTLLRSQRRRVLWQLPLKPAARQSEVLASTAAVLPQSQAADHA